MPTEPIATDGFQMLLKDSDTAALEPPSWYDTVRNGTNETGRPRGPMPTPSERRRPIQDWATKQNRYHQYND